VTRKKLFIIAGLVGGLFLFGSCLLGSEEPSASRKEDCSDDAKSDDELTASDIPLPNDYTTAAERRIGPDNYKRELARIAREIAAAEVEEAPPEPSAQHSSKAH
jgi:hypothetical protein